MSNPEAPRPRRRDIHLERVTKRFGEMTAVDELTLSIERGAFYALLGPSGCGKTTTLRMIGGFEDPTEGKVYLGGEEVTQLPPTARRQHGLPVLRAVPAPVSVEKNVGFGLERKKVSKKEVSTRVGEALEMVQLGQLAKRKPAQLSGGQQQRVALARALVNRPRALLLDEPLGALDLRLRKQLQIELKRIQQEVGITFVHVTHDQEEAMTMADTIAVMRGGKIEQAGTATELYERPRTEFVANFLGVSNLVDGRCAPRERHTRGSRPTTARSSTLPDAAAQGRRRPRRRAAREGHLCPPARRCRAAPTSCAARSSWPRSWGSRSST